MDVLWSYSKEILKCMVEKFCQWWVFRVWGGYKFKTKKLGQEKICFTGWHHRSVDIRTQNLLKEERHSLFWCGKSEWETDRNKMGEGDWERQTESEREAGLSAPGSHLSLAALTPQLQLVQSTVTGREPDTGLRKTPTQPLHIQREAQRNRMSLEQMKISESSSVFCSRTARMSNLL